MRAVWGTTETVTGLNFPGDERKVLELALPGGFQMFPSWFILGEVNMVFKRRFGWDRARAIRAIAAL